MSYRLVIHDDPNHSFDYVIDLFVRVLGVGHREAFELAAKIHEEGSASVNFFDLANVREAEERLLSGGADRSVEGAAASLVVSVEQVDGAKVKVLSRGRVGARGYEPLDANEVDRLHASSQQLFGHFDARHCFVGRGVACPVPQGVFALLAIIGVLFVAMIAML